MTQKKTAEVDLADKLRHLHEVILRRSTAVFRTSSVPGRSPLRGTRRP